MVSSPDPSVSLPLTSFALSIRSIAVDVKTRVWFVSFHVGGSGTLQMCPAPLHQTSAASKAEVGVCARMWLERCSGDSSPRPNVGVSACQHKSTALLQSEECVRCAGDAYAQVFAGRR